MILVRPAVLAIWVAFTAVACAPSPPPTSAPTSSVSGTMPTLNQKWTMVGSVMMSNPPTITFDGVKAGGFTGCNSWGGEAVFGANQSLRFEKVVQTEMACMDAAGAAEQEFGEILPKVKSYAFNDQGLLILKDEAGAEIMALDSQQQ